MLRNITFSAEESLIAAARERAQMEEKTTLNHVFREWLTSYAQRRQGGRARAVAYYRLMDSFKLIPIDRMPSRDERNAR